MLILLALPVVVVVAALHRCLVAFAPSNVLIRSARRHESRWRAIFILWTLGTSALLAMHFVAKAIDGGASGWLNVVVLALAWDAIKFMLATVARLVRWVGVVLCPSRPVGASC